MEKFWNRGSWTVGLLVFLVLLVLYLFTLAPTVLHIDSGELAAVQYTFGISHPTGYPLFTLLGYLFLKLPLGLRPIVQSNLLSALWTAGGIGVFGSFLFEVLKHGQEQRKKQAEKANKKAVESPIGPALPAWASLAGNLVFGSTLTIWAQATSVEVYSLQILLFSLIALSLWRIYLKPDLRNWSFAAVCIALGFGNHMTTLMALPLALTLYLFHFGLRKEGFRLIWMPTLLGIGLMAGLYALLFWRAGMNPPLSWGNLHDWTTLKRHLTGHQYRTWMLAGSKVAARNLGEWLRALPKEWGYLAALLIPFGFGQGFSRSRAFSLGLLISFVFTLFYVSQYDIKDLETYYIWAMLVLAWFLSWGLMVAAQSWKPSLWPALCLLPLFSMALNYKQSDQRKTTFLEDYTQAALNQLEPNALVISQQWDFLITPYYYLKCAEGRYPQLMVLDKELVRRSWYVKHQAALLDRNIFEGAEAEKAAFLAQLKPFEEDKPYVGEQIEIAYQNLIGRIITNQLKKRPVYIGIECLQNNGLQIPKGLKLVPVAFWVKVVPESTGYVEATLPKFELHVPQNWKGKGEQAYYANFIRSMWNNTVQNRAQYEADHQRPDAAKKWAEAMIPAW